MSQLAQDLAHSAQCGGVGGGGNDGGGIDRGGLVVVGGESTLICYHGFGAGGGKRENFRVIQISRRARAPNMSEVALFGKTGDYRQSVTDDGLKRRVMTDDELKRRVMTDDGLKRQNMTDDRLKDAR